MEKKIYVLLLLLIFAHKPLVSERSIHRPKDPNRPTITTSWATSPTNGESYTLTSHFLEEWAIFGRFNKEYLLNHQLPKNVSYRYKPEVSISREILTQLIDHFIKELSQLKRKTHTFTDFTVLKDRDFNYKNRSGVIIVKFKHYPFVVKLLMETPKSFTRPFSKGIEPAFFFVMGSGINRYLAGFTRIPNLHAINKIIAQDSYWSTRLTTPRKWFWTPKNVRWFTVTGKNIGGKPEQSKNFPSTYAIICDTIRFERELSMTSKHDRKIAMKLSRFIGNRIDPNIYNFIIEKDTGLIAFIDTEHFASIVGLREPLYFNHYASWYTRLGGKCIADSMLQTKRAKKIRQTKPIPKILIV